MKKREKNIILRRLIHSYLSSVISISLVLLFVGIIGILAVNAKSVSDYFKENIKLSVIFEKDITSERAKEISERLKSREFVKKAEFISQEQGTKEMKELLGEDFLDIFEVNPIPLSVDLYFKADYVLTDSIEVIEKELMADPGVKELVYQKSLVNVINQNMARIGIVLSIFVVLLLFVSFVLINNTVRLNVYSKRFTIHTMKLVGAKRSFIRKPFLIQGMYQGLIAGVISVALLSLILYFVWRDLRQLYLIFDQKLILLVLLSVIVSGVLICLISTYFVVNRLVSVNSDEIYY
ncbi:MAG: permease-like cell division protein FtsX [Bacteroidales bacterium]